MKQTRTLLVHRSEIDQYSSSLLFYEPMVKAGWVFLTIQARRDLKLRMDDEEEKTIEQWKWFRRVS